MKENLPPIVTLSAESSGTKKYDNHAVAHLNDHVVRISTMTEPYPWHCHPNSDETFLAVEGGLVIEFEHGEIQLVPGQMATVSLNLVEYEDSRATAQPEGRKLAGQPAADETG